MFDTSSLEAQVQAYVEEKLQELAVAIADRIHMTDSTGKSVQDCRNCSVGNKSRYLRTFQYDT